MGTVALDTSVVVALFDPTDVHHVEVREDLRVRAVAHPDYLVSVVVLAESLVGAAKLGTGKLARARSSFAEAFGVAREVDEQVAEAAAVLRAQHSWLRLPDALILATAQIEGADVVLTVDRRWSKVSGTVQLVGRSRPSGRAR